MRTVVCVGAGPSIHQTDLDYARSRAVVAVTNAMYTRAPWADLLYACDFGFWAEHIERVALAFSGPLWTMDDEAAAKWPTRLNHVQGCEGVDLDASGLSWGGSMPWGGNSGFQLMHLMIRLGAERIVLTGYDMGATGCGHCHDDHPEHMGNPMSHLFPKWIEGFNAAAIQAKAMGIEIINATRNSALECFPRMTMREALP